MPWLLLAAGVCAGYCVTMASNPLRRFSSELPPGAVRLGGRLTRGVQVVLGVYAAAFVLSTIPAVGRFMADHLALRPAQALGPQPWQLFTAPLLLFSFIQLLFTGLLLYFVGSAVEQILGTRRFLRLCVSASLAASLCAAALGRVWPRHGLELITFEAAPVFMALLGAQIGLFGEQQALLFGMGKPVSVRALSIFFMGLALFAYLWNGHYLLTAAALCAVAVGLRAGHVSLDPVGRARRLWRTLRKKRAEAQRRRFTVLSGGLPPQPQKPHERRWVN